ncbi:hypothetical protein [Paraburkholderia sp. SIMBA_054]|uniref:hypothetical protein n=1 Tax=Paraburkholderia sp. SIMBA_054 TaxID=3085795 RepID=UPI00397C09A3
MLGELMTNCQAIFEESFGADRAPIYQREARRQLDRIFQSMPDRFKRVGEACSEEVRLHNATKAPQLQKALRELEERLNRASRQTYELPSMPLTLTDQQVLAPIRRTMDGRGRVLPSPVTKDYFDFAATVRLAAGVKYESDLPGDFLGRLHFVPFHLQGAARIERLLKNVKALSGTPHLEVDYREAPFYFVLVPPSFTLGQTLMRLNELSEAQAQESADVRERFADVGLGGRNADANRWRIVLVAEDEKQRTAARVSGFSTLDASKFAQGSTPRIDMPRPMDVDANTNAADTDDY